MNNYTMNITRWASCLGSTTSLISLMQIMQFEEVILIKLSYKTAGAINTQYIFAFGHRIFGFWCFAHYSSHCIHYCPIPSDPTFSVTISPNHAHSFANSPTLTHSLSHSLRLSRLINIHALVSEWRVWCGISDSVGYIACCAICQCVMHTKIVDPSALSELNMFVSSPSQRSDKT
jgi:hypothetical protein